MRYRIRHHTVYRYAEPVRRSVHELRLAPRSGPLQAVHGWQIAAPGRLSEARDGFGNIVHSFTLGAPSDTIGITAWGEVEVLGMQAGTHGAFQDAGADGEVRVSPLYFLSATPLTAAPAPLRAFAAPFLAARRDVPALLALAAAVAARVRYRPNATSVDTAAAEAFARGAGVCQDQAQVMVAACRSQGIPARYVSGYFYDPKAEALASHAWADICLDAGRGLWCSIDVTHRCLTGGRHVRLAVGRDYPSAAPIRGVREGGSGEALSVRIEIMPAQAGAA